MATNRKDFRATQNLTPEDEEIIKLEREQLFLDTAERVITENHEALTTLGKMSNDTLKYKDFFGSVEYSADDDCFFGKIIGTTDLVTFEGDSVDSLKAAFAEAVEDYLILCKEVGKEPQKTYKGSFNVPNAVTIVANEEVEEMKRNPHLYKSFDSVEALFEELKRDDND